MYRYSIIFLVSLLALFSCEDVIEIELPNGIQQIAIDAFLEEGTKPQAIITLTAAYNNQSSTERLSNTKVTIADDSNPPNIAELYEVEGQGYYTTLDDYSSEVGRNYTLTVEYNGKIYTATDVMKRNGSLDNVKVMKETPGDSYYSVYIYGQETKGVGDNYRWIVYQNGEPILHPSLIFVRSDEFADGAYFDDYQILNGGLAQYETGVEILEGAKIQVKQISISDQCYEFYSQVKQISSIQSPFSPPPANAPTNFDNGAVGFFRASSVIMSDEITVPAK